MRLHRLLAAAGVFSASLALCAPARADDPDRVEWVADWPRVRASEVAMVAALTLASIGIEAEWSHPTAARWKTPLLFDNAVRGALRGRTQSLQRAASDISDDFYKGGVLAPYVIDVFFVSLGVHENADVALQMSLIDLQSLGIAGIASLAAEHGVGRERPYVRDCGPDRQVRDAGGRPLLNACGTDGDFQSFLSGHAAATATVAGLTCVHHQHLPLYGGGLADLAPCVVMIGVSATTGLARLVADRHWGTDVLSGWSLGAFAGYVVPSLLHYGFGSGRPVGEVRIGDVQLVPTPRAYDHGAGVGVAGFF